MARLTLIFESRGLYMTIMRVLPQMTPENTALIIVDMQHDFLDDGAPCLVQGGRKIIPALGSLLHECRALHMPVIHVHTVWHKDGSDMPPFTTSEEFKKRGLRQGEPGTDIIPELAPLSSECVVIKKRYSGFYLTDLELQLRTLGVAYVIVAGVATAFCVRATVQDACYRDFVAVVPRECVTSDTDDEHEQSLKDIQKGFGKVQSLQEVVQLLKSKPVVRSDRAS
jgi:biuret amidohydrolase